MVFGQVGSYKNRRAGQCRLTVAEVSSYGLAGQISVV